MYKVYWQKAVASYAKGEYLALWLENEFYYLKNEGKNILMTKDVWLNNRIMDADQKLNCKGLGKMHIFQSVLNSQKRSNYPFRAVNNEPVQLLHDGNNHWLLFQSSGCV